MEAHDQYSPLFHVFYRLGIPKYAIRAGVLAASVLRV